VTPARAVLITGASGAIGAATARLLHHHGWTPVIAYDRGEERAATLSHQLPGSRTLRLPLTERATIGRGIEILAGWSLDVQALCLCASPPPSPASFLKTTALDLRTHFEATVVGNHCLIAELWRRIFRARGGGRVTAVLTAAMLPPVAPHLAAYVAAKSALLGLLEVAAAELGPAGLEVNAVAPSYTETPMLEAFPSLLLDLARKQAPGGRFLTAEAVAQEIFAALTAAVVPGSVTVRSVPGDQPP
jgi:NAD(P)-dependent dehydrogenase (short-subunit alcohol dehydrogenase family)